ncbi:MAG: twin-arginine translocase subunit TatC [Planctomycetes bacterium]|nr:twin-arginine translocase subunit TatC [Planctomycetota bacterium]
MAWNLFNNLGRAAAAAKGQPMPPESPRPSAPPEDPGAVMSLFSHLEELRKRLFLAAWGIVPFLLLGLVFLKPLTSFLLMPLQKLLQERGLPAALISTAPMESFNTAFKIALIAAALAGSPWILYQLWRFVAPGLYAHEKRFVRFLLPLSLVLTLAGVATLFYMILPLALSFLINFSAELGLKPFEVPTLAPEITTPLLNLPVLDGDPTNPAAGSAWVVRQIPELRVALPIDGGGISIVSVPLAKSAGVLPQFRISEYINFVLLLTLSFSIGFQLPVVLLLLSWIGILKDTHLKKFRRYALLVCVIASALVTPGDPLTLALAAIPFYGLYELSILLIKWFPAKRVAGKKETGRERWEDPKPPADPPPSQPPPQPPSQPPQPWSPPSSPPMPFNPNAGPDGEPFAGPRVEPSPGPDPSRDLPPLGMSDEEISRINEQGMSGAGQWYRANGAPPEEPRV